MIAALVPAAGSSSRLGQPKLLLKLEGQTIIGRLVGSLRDGGARRVIVIAPPNDAPEGLAVATEARLAGAEVVVPPDRPACMRASIELGLDTLARRDPPRSVLLTPGDYPGINAEIVAQIVKCAAERPDRIVIPSHDGRRGHPIVLPWRIAAEIPSLPVDVGVNALVVRHGDLVVEITIAGPEIIADLDTPDDLQEWVQRQNSRGRPAEEIGLQMPDPRSRIPDSSRSETPDSGAPRSGCRFCVIVRLFAVAKDRAGRPEVAIELAHGSTIRDLRLALGESLPALAPMLATAMIALDEEYANDDARISPGARLAVIPPVSGGAGRGRADD